MANGLKDSVPNPEPTHFNYGMSRRYLVWYLSPATWVLLIILTLGGLVTGVLWWFGILLILFGIGMAMTNMFLGPYALLSQLLWVKAPRNLGGQQTAKLPKLFCR